MIMRNQFFVFFALFLFSFTSVGNSFAEDATINIDNTFYEKSDIISIWGTVSSNMQDTAFLTIKDSTGNTVWTEKLSLDEKGEFSTLVIAGISNWTISGNYNVILESDQGIEATFFYDSGPQVNPPSVAFTLGPRFRKPIAMRELR